MARLYCIVPIRNLIFIKTYAHYLFGSQARVPFSNDIAGLGQIPKDFQTKLLAALHQLRKTALAVQVLFFPKKVV
jgi:hypothetical protein